MLSKYQYNNITTATTFIWIGFVCAISFMEAWLKFQAPGIDARLGVGIGKLVFAALNKVEITSILLIIVSVIISNQYNKCIIVLLTVLFGILAIQSFWLLPLLSDQADMLINNIKVDKTNHHVVFVMLEVLKVTTLFILGRNLLKRKCQKAG